MVTFTINIPQMLAYIPYMDPMGFLITIKCLITCFYNPLSYHHQMVNQLKHQLNVKICVTKKPFKRCLMGYWWRSWYAHTWIFQVCLLGSFTKRHQKLFDFLRIVFSSESLVEKSWNRNCPNQITPLDMFWFTQITLIQLIHVYICLGLPKLSHHMSCFRFIQ